MFSGRLGRRVPSTYNYLREHGISQRISCPHTPEQTGCAERKHRHIVEIGHALLTHASIPLHYWTYAFECAIYTLNRLPFDRTKPHSPFEILFRSPPNYNDMRIFGSLFYPWFKPYSPHKLAPRSTKCVFLDYSK